MHRTILAPAECGGAALSELKQWLAITTAGEDAALTRLIAAALDMCEAFTGLMPLAQTCEEVLEAEPGWLRIATGPVQAITGLEVVAPDGTRTALPVDAYSFDLAADGAGMVHLRQPKGISRLAVRFVAGLAPGWGSLPDGLRHGVLRMAAHLHIARDATFRDGASQDEPPAAIAALWRGWRRMRIA